MFKKFVCKLIRTYQGTLGGRTGLFSIIVGGGCLHSPSCSEYTYHAVAKYGAVAGLCMGIGRVTKCNSFFK